MEGNEVSIHQVRIYKVFSQTPGAWLTSKEVANKAAVSGRTARLHCLRMVKLGLLDQAEVFPGHRYQLSSLAAKRNQAYVLRLEHAAAVFGV